MFITKGETKYVKIDKDFIYFKGYGFRNTPNIIRNILVSKLYYVCKDENTGIYYIVWKLNDNSKYPVLLSNGEILKCKIPLTKLIHNDSNYYFNNIPLNFSEKLKHEILNSKCKICKKKAESIIFHENIIKLDLCLIDDMCENCRKNISKCVICKQVKIITKKHGICDCCNDSIFNITDIDCDFKRYNVFKIDDFTCVYCGETFNKIKVNKKYERISGINLTPVKLFNIDHFIPKSKGGSDNIDNLVTSCQDCNEKKSSSLWDIKFISDERRKHIKYPSLFGI